MFNVRIFCTVFTLGLAPLTQATGLLELYSEAIESDPRLISAQAEVSVGKAQKRQSLASLLPQASLNSSVSKNRYKSGDAASQRYKGKRHVLSVTQPLYNRELWLDNEVYALRVEQKQSELNEIKSSIGLDLAQRYIDVLSAENSLTLIKAEKESTKIQLGLLTSRLKRQLAVKTDVLDVKARLQSLKVDEITAENDVLIAREGLTELVNRPVDEPLNDFVDDIFYQPTRTLDEWVKYSLEHNDYLLSFEKEVSAAVNSLKKKKSAHLPNLSLQFSAQRSNIGYENAPSADTDSLAATLRLSVPIYSGGSIKAGELEQRARITIAEQQLERYRRQLVKSVRAASLSGNANWKRIDASRQAVTAAMKAHEAMEKGFTYGTVTVVDVLDALNKKLQALLNFKKAQYDFVLSHVELQQLAGTLNFKSMQKTSSWQTIEK
jgi:outer membrane protein